MMDTILRWVGWICLVAFIGGSAIATISLEWSGYPSGDPVVLFFGTIGVCGGIGVLASLLLRLLIGWISGQEGFL
jgi:hypothetical protein